MSVSFVSTLANSSPVARRSVGFCEGVRTRCKPSAATAAAGARALSATISQSAEYASVRAIIDGECTIAEHPTACWIKRLRCGMKADRASTRLSESADRVPADLAAEPLGQIIIDIG